MTDLTTRDDAREAVPSDDALLAVIMRGDLRHLTAKQRVDYINALCRSLGLNPLTQPFAFIEFQSKVICYAKRDAADQLRRIHGISVEIVERKITDGILTVHVRARDPSGRVDEDWGAVSLPDNIKGEFRANTILKGITKAKRRVTLSICGLGFLDETEVESMVQASRAPADPPRVISSTAGDAPAETARAS